MNLINPGGLLWFDDDTRRPIQQKIAEAAQRFRERVGFEPTVCQLNPAQATALEASVAQATTRSKRASAHPTPALPESLRLVPSDLIQPHCYLLGIAEGEQPRVAVLPYRDDDESRPSSTARRPDAGRRTREAASGAAPVAAATTTRRAATPARRVHAVQPPLIAEPEGLASARAVRGGRGKATKAATASVAAPSPATPAMSTAQKPTRAARTPKTKTQPAAAIPVSLLAAAPDTPKKATVKVPRASARGKSAASAGVAAPIAAAPEAQPVTPQALKPKQPKQPKRSATTGQTPRAIGGADVIQRGRKRSA